MNQQEYRAPDPISASGGGPWARLPHALGRIPTGLFLVIPAFFMTTAIIGAVRWYSPVPFWDMWDAYINHYLFLLEDRVALFFFWQTNEHRIVFSKILFWLDLRFFGGRSLVLVPFNILLAAGIWVTLSAAAKRLLGDRRDLWAITALSLAAPCFSWMQEPNITWGFQSQFFVAYLFPLLAFACLAMSAAGPRRTAWFAAAVAFGIASLGTMANGLLAMPLLFVMLLLMGRPSWPRMAAIVILGAAATSAWFYLYLRVPRDHASLGDIVQFFLSFLGLPFTRFSRSLFVLSKGLLVGYAAAIVFLAASASCAVTWFRNRAGTDPMFLALMTMLGYIVGTGVVISLGRADGVATAADAARYATPTLLAWATLGILFAYRLKALPYARALFSAGGLMVAIGLTPTQMNVFSAEGPEIVYQRMRGALALKMDIMDRQAIGAIYPVGTPDQVASIKASSGAAKKNHLSIFADPDLEAAVAKVGSPVDAGFHACKSAMDVVEPIEDEDRFRRITGWVFDERKGPVGQFVNLAAGDTIVGVAVVGGDRTDVVHAFGDKARHSGFQGYVTTDAAPPFTLLCADAP